MYFDHEELLLLASWGFKVAPATSMLFWYMDCLPEITFISKLISPNTTYICTRNVLLQSYVMRDVGGCEVECCIGVVIMAPRSWFRDRERIL